MWVVLSQLAVHIERMSRMPLWAALGCSSYRRSSMCAASLPSAISVGGTQSSSISSLRSIAHAYARPDFDPVQVRSGENRIAYRCMYTYRHGSTGRQGVSMRSGSYARWRLMGRD